MQCLSFVSIAYKTYKCAHYPNRYAHTRKKKTTSAVSTILKFVYVDEQRPHIKQSNKHVNEYTRMQNADECPAYNDADTIGLSI